MTERLLVFMPRYNSAGRRDATGAFHPEAARIVGLYPGSTALTFDNTLSMGQRRDAVLDGIRAVDRYGVTGVAFLCHGWVDGIQAGFTRKTAGELARVIGLSPDISRQLVVLYCCSTGADPQDSPRESAGCGDGSFADILRDELCRQGSVGCRVVAHGTAGHTTQNPYALFFDGMGIPDGGVGGYAPVRPSTSAWPKWRAALRTGDLRFRFPFMSAAEIHAELLGGRENV